MTGRLADKSVLITGAAAARGLGAAMAALFAREGATLLLSDVDDVQGEQRVVELRAMGAVAEYFHMDVSREQDWASAIAAIMARHGHLDVLVNNAGIFAIEDIEATSLALWERVFAVNQTGVFLGMKHAAPALRASGGGSIVNVSSIGGLVGFGPAAAYQASKGAVRLLSKDAAIRYASERIRVNSLHPGVIRTQMADDIDDAVIAGFDAQTPMGLGEPLDIAYAALFLAGDESRYMTGAELVVDGGYSAR